MEEAQHVEVLNWFLALDGRVGRLCVHKLLDSWVNMKTDELVDEYYM